MNEINDMQNILFIFADQMQAFAMGCMGNTHVQTPNLDALAADGVLLRNAYSDSPVCTPYRGCLMTGRYPAQTGVRWNNDSLPEGERCLGHFLGDAGYAASYVGKWHLGGTGNVPIEAEGRAGFRHFIGYQCYNSFVDGVNFFDEDGACRRFDRHRTTVTTDLAIERMEMLKDRPFAQFISYQNPHYPLEPLPEFAALYAGATVPRRPNHQDCEVYTPTGSPPSPKPREADPNYQRYGRGYEAFMRCYYAMITQLDHEVGRLIRWLRQEGLYERTLIIFTSDHGENACSHGVMNKGDWWEESTRVPLVVRAPEGLRGRVVETPVSAGVDIWPTLADSADYRAETKDLAGTSWLPLVRDPDAVRPTPVFAEFAQIHQREFSNWVMVRSGDWKLVTRQDDFSVLGLYDLAKDPYELEDRSDDDQCATIRDELLQYIIDWRERAPGYAYRSPKQQQWMDILERMGGSLPR